MDRMFVNIKWQMLHRGYRLRPVIVYFLVMDLVLAILPVSVCCYLDQNFGYLVMLVNLTYALSILYFFLTGIAYVDEQDSPADGELFRLAEPNPWYRLFARLFTNIVVSLFSFGNALLGSNLMNKFADEHHSYFKLVMRGNIPLGFLYFALLFPLVYRWIRLEIRRNNVKAFFIPTLILAYLIADLFRNISMLLYPGWLSGVAVTAILTAAFWKSGALENKQK